MSDIQEIAISNDFICPNQDSVDLLRKAQQDRSLQGLFGDCDMNNFTIYSVPNRVVEILDGFNAELYGKIASGEITPIGLLQMAQARYHEETKATSLKVPISDEKKLKKAA